MHMLAGDAPHVRGDATVGQILKSSTYDPVGTYGLWVKKQEILHGEPKECIRVSS